MSEEWVKKMWYVYTVKYHSVVKKNEIMPFPATWVGVEVIMPSEVSQKVLDKYPMTSVTCGV